MVLSVAPLGLIGVVAALMLSGRPLGFVAILGVLALLGMISKNAVILIGQIDAERALGQDGLGRCDRCQQLPFSADHVDGRIDCSRDDSNRADGVLGTDGIRDHGRPAGRDRSDAGLPADAVCRLVRRDGAGRAHPKRRTSRSGGKGKAG